MLSSARTTPTNFTSVHIHISITYFFICYYPYRNRHNNHIKIANNKRQTTAEKRAKNKELEEKLKATNIQRNKEEAIVKEKEAKMATITKEETAKAARLEKEKEKLAQSKLEAHQGKDGKEKETAKEEEAKAPVIVTETAADVAEGQKGRKRKEILTRNYKRRKRNENRPCRAKQQRARKTRTKRRRRRELWRPKLRFQQIYKLHHVNHQRNVIPLHLPRLHW